MEPLKSWHEGDTRFPHHKTCLNPIACVCVKENLGVTAGVVKHKRGLGGLRISTSLVQGLGMVHLVLLHLRVQLGELLVALCRAGEILDVIVAVAQQR